MILTLQYVSYVFLFSAQNEEIAEEGREELPNLKFEHEELK